MATIEPSLFDWRDVEARSDLDRFDLARDHLPDARLLQYLEVMRAGRNRSSEDSLFCRAVVQQFPPKNIPFLEQKVSLS